jgi:hypothetical protein
MEGDDLKYINKNLDTSNKTVIEQNKKINQINEKVDEVNKNMKVTQGYVSGFRSFFGFFPKLFSFSKKGTNKENVPSQTEKVDDRVDKVVEPNKAYTDDVDDAEILKQTAKMLNRNIKTSLEGSEGLDNKITKTEGKALYLKKETDKVVQSYK